MDRLWNHKLHSGLKVRLLTRSHGHTRIYKYTPRLQKCEVCSNFPIMAQTAREEISRPKIYLYTFKKRVLCDLKKVTSCLQYRTLPISPNHYQAAHMCAWDSRRWKKKKFLLLKKEKSSVSLLKLDKGKNTENTTNRTGGKNADLPRNLCSKKS